MFNDFTPSGLSTAQNHQDNTGNADQMIAAHD